MSANRHAQEVQHRHLFVDASTPFRALFDAMSAMVLIIDEHLVVHDMNLSAERRFGPDAEIELTRLCGDVLRCLRAGPKRHFNAGPCGTTPSCKACVLRQSVDTALRFGPTARRPYAMRLREGAQGRETYFLVTATPMEHEGHRYAMLLLEDVTELQELRKIVPICAWCRKVYVRGQYQSGIERLVRENSLSDFTHGICPDCAAIHFPAEPDDAG